MASKAAFTTETMVGAAMVGACLFTVDMAKSEELGSTTQKITLGVAAAIALAITSRTPIVGFILTTMVVSYAIKSHTGRAKAIKRFTPSEENKSNQLAAYDHNTGVTLEEEQVHNMIPYATNTPSTQTYQPVLGPQHLATHL